MKLMKENRMTHYIKLNETFEYPVLNGDKNFEIRKNDRGYNKGDLIQFRVVNDEGLIIGSKLDNILYEITYVINGWGLKEDYVVFGIKEYKGDK